MPKSSASSKSQELGHIRLGNKIRMGFESEFLTAKFEVGQSYEAPSTNPGQSGLDAWNHRQQAEHLRGQRNLCHRCWLKGRRGKYLPDSSR